MPPQSCPHTQTHINKYTYPSTYNVTHACVDTQYNVCIYWKNYEREAQWRKTLDVDL